MKSFIEVTEAEFGDKMLLSISSIQAIYRKNDGGGCTIETIMNNDKSYYVMSLDVRESYNKLRKILIGEN